MISLRTFSSDFKEILFFIYLRNIVYPVLAEAMYKYDDKDVDLAGLRSKWQALNISQLCIHERTGWQESPGYFW